MKTSYKSGLLAALAYIIFELSLYFFGWNHLEYKHALAFATSSLILLIAIAFSILKEFQAIKNQSPSFIIDLKNGIKTAAIYALLVASFSFIYYKWVDDYAMIKKEQLINMTIDEGQMLEIAKKQIERNPDFYRGKSPEDLIDMQQENINANLNPSIVFPFILFSQTLLGIVYAFLMTALNRLVLSKLNH